jgi:hypothetical protein
MNATEVRKLEAMRDEMAYDRANRQGYCGEDHLQLAIKYYLQIGFQDGFDAAAELLSKQIEEKEMILLHFMEWLEAGFAGMFGHESTTASQDFYDMVPDQLKNALAAYKLKGSE